MFFKRMVASNCSDVCILLGTFKTAMSEFYKVYFHNTLDITALIITLIVTKHPKY